MAKRRLRVPKQGSSYIDEALAELSAAELREWIRTVLPELDDRLHERVVSRLVDMAARSSEWTPGGPSEDLVTSIVAFADAAKLVGYADPSDVDDYLRQAVNAFLGKNYQAACQIFHALLGPIGDVEIDLGQHEMLDEVLGVDVGECASQYVVAVYMTRPVAERARAVQAAIGEASGTGHFWAPLREIERVAIEPLPQFEEFLGRWRELIEQSSGESRSYFGLDETRWLREVVQRLEGVDGLARIARSTRDADDLRAWCQLLVKQKSWNDAMAAYDEAAEIVGEAYARGEFLDGAALAAQQLDRKDLPARLERAWRGAPGMLRLRRWLGSSKTKSSLRKRATEALAICSKKQACERAFLHVVLGDIVLASRLLAAAPGLGWSAPDHPGHLLFPLFVSMLGGSADFASASDPLSTEAMDLDELKLMMQDSDDPRLTTPEVSGILDLAATLGPVRADARATLIRAMQKAAEKRLAGVTEHKRRRQYGHASSLAKACIAVDPAPRTTKWLAGLRDEYRRYPALQREFARS